LSSFKRAWKSNFRKVLEDRPLFKEAQELDENFSLLTYEILIVIYIIAFGVTEYSMRGNMLGENNGDILFIIVY